jgi:hypothetical protein
MYPTEVRYLKEKEKKIASCYKIDNKQFRNQKCLGWDLDEELKSTHSGL